MCSRRVSGARESPTAPGCATPSGTGSGGKGGCRMTIMELKDKLYYMAGTREEADVLRETLALLRTHPDAQPNEPLTVAELLGMKGDPVWLQSKEQKELGRWVIVDEVDPDLGFVSFEDGVLIDLKKSGDKLALYRRPPKED